MALAGPVLQPYVYLRWLIQHCLSAQHMWLPFTPLCKPYQPNICGCRFYSFVNPLLKIKIANRSVPLAGCS